MKIIAVANIKGGVGKTTLTQHLAVGLAKKGKRVLAVDSDCQANLSTGFGVYVKEDEPYIYDYLMGDRPLMDVALEREGVLLVPSCLGLAAADVELSRQPGADILLREALKQEIGRNFDYVILDSQPDLGLLTRNCLAAADSVIIPMQSEFFSLDGVKLLENIIAQYKKRLNPGLHVRGVVLTRHGQHVTFQRDVAEETQRRFKDVLFSSYIRQCVSLVEASAAGKSVFSYAPTSTAAKDYEDVVDEFIKRGAA
jgi:chromosome partitioning protein